MTDQSL